MELVLTINCLGSAKKISLHFQRLTLDNTVIMGRKTFESIGKKPLRDRVNIVLTQTLPIRKEYGIISRIEHIKSLNDCNPDNMYWIIGGPNLFDALIEDVSYIHETVIHNYFNCDTYVKPIPTHFERCYLFNKSQYVPIINIRNREKYEIEDFDDALTEPPTERFSMRLYHNPNKTKYQGFEEHLEHIVGTALCRASLNSSYPIKRISHNENSVIGRSSS